ncbi:hypothetical protein EYF80_040718 [Liparis tanakae]|uniref:Uncharacterized protein n=1 Tax=Liparis tanakae TaxID=230148 RepID=A0A4Z2G838_9TELE|nr:hypothetical protein EYF80_040718 [Liparis tanakae]
MTVVRMQLHTAPSKPASIEGTISTGDAEEDRMNTNVYICSCCALAPISSTGLPSIRPEMEVCRHRAVIWRGSLPSSAQCAGRMPARIKRVTVRIPEPRFPLYPAADNHLSIAMMRFLARGSCSPVTPQPPLQSKLQVAQLCLLKQDSSSEGFCFPSTDWSPLPPGAVRSSASWKLFRSFGPLSSRPSPITPSSPHSMASSKMLLPLA